MYKVLNKLKDIRKFRDRKVGKEIYVAPGETVLTNGPPESDEVFEVTKVEEKEKKNKKEMIKYDSSSSSNE